MAPRHQPSRECHVVVLGAGGVGKSCLTTQFVHNQWVESYDPTIEDTYRTQVSVDGRQVVLEILDTAGTEQFVAMRDLYMKTGQGFLLVFSITSPSSLSELSILREEIMRIKDDNNVPIVLVGNKADLEDQRGVTRNKAFNLSSQWNVPYYEASARTRTNVDEIFVDLCRQVLRKDDAESGGHTHYEEDTRHTHSSHFPSSHSHHRSGRKRRRRKEHRCTIL